MDSPKDWLASRTPTAPDELRAWLTIADVVTKSSSRAVAVSGLLAEAGRVHLDKAVARPGRDRGAAHELLAADALITYACEAAGEATDVDAVLHDILSRVRTGDEGA